MCHTMICQNFELIDFVTSYKKASCIPQIKNKRISKELLEPLLSYEGWKPLNDSVVCFQTQSYHKFVYILQYFNVLYLLNYIFRFESLQQNLILQIWND